MSAKETLNDLRREIDIIDEAIHDLIMRRTKVVQNVRYVKKDDKIKIRPDREADIIYRLMLRHQGPFPKRELCRMWRELIVATLSMEGPFSVAVFEPENKDGYWDIARDQYGSYVSMTGYSSKRRIIDVVGGQEATLGILPMPQADEADPWWRHLASEDKEAPKVITRLPFAGLNNRNNKNLEALVICPVAQKPTGRDRSLIIVQTNEQITISRLGELFMEFEIPLITSFAWNDPQKAATWMYLAETSEYINNDDFRILALGGKQMFTSVMVIGGYATPLGEDELDNVGDGA